MDLKQLALKLGLSSTTVSRVLSGKADQFRISPETQKKVLAAAGQEQMTVNQTARSLRLRKSHVIGLIVPDISNPFFATLARHVESTAKTGDYSVLLADSQESLAVEVENVSVMLSRGVDGLIIAPVSGLGAHLMRFSKTGKPQVLVDRVSPDLPVDSVVVDNFAAARQGVWKLSVAGHRAIACIRGHRESFTDRERFRGYETMMKELRLPTKKEWIVGGDYFVKNGADGMEALLRGRNRPSAVLALGNLLALGALQTLRTAGLSVPQDMSIISFDEQPWAALLAPPLTTIAQPAEEIGETAGNLLLNRLKEGGTEYEKKRVVLPFSVVDRMSIGSRQG